MILPLLQSPSLLAKAAIAAAYTVDPIDLHPGQPSTRELILIRYATPPVSGHFDFHAIRRKHGSPMAMWTDYLTEVPGRMGDITATYMPENITALQVIRLILPAPFDIGSLARRSEGMGWVQVGPLKRAEGASEFWLNFDIFPHQVATIPIAIVQGAFAIDPNVHYEGAATQHAPLQAATYAVDQGGNGQISCVLS